MEPTSSASTLTKTSYGMSSFPVSPISASNRSSSIPRGTLMSKRFSRVRLVSGWSRTPPKALSVAAKDSTSTSVRWTTRATGCGRRCSVRRKTSRGHKSLALDPVGNVLLTGEFSGVADFGNFQLIGAGSSDATRHSSTRRMGPSSARWRIGGSDRDSTGSIGTDAAGNVFTQVTVRSSIADSPTGESLPPGEYILKFRTPATTPTQGDITGDGRIDRQDVAILAANFVVRSTNRCGRRLRRRSAPLACRSDHPPAEPHEGCPGSATILRGAQPVGPPRHGDAIAQRKPHN